uniref:Uncharacterized protein n=1 Tax=Gopherus agassizii TaxID=38772 RepID=A0A452I122_9SAUR
MGRVFNSCRSATCGSLSLRVTEVLKSWFKDLKVQRILQQVTRAPRCRGRRKTSRASANLPWRKIPSRPQIWVLGPVPRPGSQWILVSVPRLGGRWVLVSVPRPDGGWVLGPVSRPGDEWVLGPVPRPGGGWVLVSVPRLGRGWVLGLVPGPGRGWILGLVPWPGRGWILGLVPRPGGGGWVLVSVPRPDGGWVLGPVHRPGGEWVLGPVPRPGGGWVLVSVPRLGRGWVPGPVPGPGRRWILGPVPGLGRGWILGPVPWPGRGWILGPGSKLSPSGPLLLPRQPSPPPRTPEAAACEGQGQGNSSRQGREAQPPAGGWGGRSLSSVPCPGYSWHPIALAQEPLVRHAVTFSPRGLRLSGEPGAALGRGRGWAGGSLWICMYNMEHCSPGGSGLDCGRGARVPKALAGCVCGRGTGIALVPGSPRSWA